MYSKNKLFGQGAVEYLVIIGVISVIALISVSITFVALNPVDLKEKATQQELKELGLSIIETSFNYSTESFLLRLKNNYSSRVTIKNIKIGDINSNFDQNLLSGANHNFLISSSEICENNEIIKDLLITFESKYGLEHVQQVKGVSFSCNEFDLREVLRFFYIPQRDLVDGIISNINILGDGNYSFSFNSGSGDAVAYYSFDSSNGSMVEDLVGNADGNLGNGASIGAGGKFGSNALIINGDNQYFDIPNFSSSQITIMGWYYFESTSGGGWNTIFCREGGTYHHLLINDASREIGFYNSSFYSSGTTLTPGTLYHFGVVKDGYNEKIYMNGNLIMNSDSSFNNSSAPFGIIGNHAADGASQGAIGWIDEVKIWDRVLSESEILAEYNLTGVGEDSNYVTKLIDTKKSSSLFDSVIVNTNGLRHGEEIDPEIEPSLANGLVALWHLNEESGEIAFDSSGNGYDGTRSSESGAGGITETIDGDYTIYTFNSSGTFTIDNDITAEVLVVAGGGAGGTDAGAGGGAGGLIYIHSYSISSGSYSVVVGDGGIGGPQYTVPKAGENSSFAGLTAIGGGAGAYYCGHAATSGGSGGGAAPWFCSASGGSQLQTSQSGDSGSYGYGNDGSPNGGGGGAGGMGEADSKGGVGLDFPQFAAVGGSPAGWFAGGGSGSGSALTVNGGGGRGSNWTSSLDPAAHGVANTGGGGGGGAGGAEGAYGGYGGSGIVIIKFLTSQGTATVSSGLSSSSGSSSGLWGTNAGNFNGSSDYIQALLATNSVSNVTLSAWFKTNNYAQAGQLVAHLGSDASGNGYGFAVNNESTTDGSLLILYSSIAWYDTGVNIIDSEWHQGVLVLNGSSQPSFYLDGELVASPSTSVPNTPTNYIEIGRNDYPSAVRYFNGSIDEVAIWDRAFSANEVSDLFNKGVAKIGIQARACASEDCSAEWSSGQYGSNEFKYFSLPRSKYFQFKITSELIPFEAKLVIPESCVSPYGADYWESCYSYFHDSSSCNAYSNHNGSCYWCEYGECYGDMWGHCYNQYDEYSCSSQNGCYWNYPYCYGDMWGYCYYNFYDESSCNSQNGCSWYNSYAGCEGDMWGYCYNNYTDEASCNAVSECSWGGDGCYSQTECYYFDYDSCQSHSPMCYWYEYGECSPTIDCYSQDQSSCYNYGGCYLEGNYCSANTECYYNYDRSSCESYPACSFNDYSYCEGGFRCEDQLNEGSSSCTVFGSGCNYTAPVSTDYLSYFYNATPKLVDINILYYN